MIFIETSIYANPTAVVGVAIVGFVFFFVLRKEKPLERNWPIVPGAKPFIGNQFGEVNDYVAKCEEWCDLYGKEKGMCETNIFGTRWLMICSDEKATFIESMRPFGIVREVNVSDAINSIGGCGLYTAEGKVWSQDRRIVAPMFNKNHVKDYMPAVKTVTKRLIDKWAQEVKSDGVGVVNISQHLLALTTDIISLVAFSMDLNLLEKGNNQVGNDIVRAFMVTMIRAISPFPYWKIPIIGGYLDGGEVSRSRLLKVVMKRIKEYENMEDSESHNTSFLGKLIAEHKKENAKLDRVRLFGHVLTTFAAGGETTCVTLVSTLYELAKDETGLQDELVAEVASLGDLEEVTFDDLTSKLPRMRSLVYEVLRIKGPAANEEYENTSPIELEGVVVPPHTKIVVMTQYIHQQESTLKGRSTPRGPRDADLKSFCARRYLVDPQDEKTPSEGPGCTFVEPTFKNGHRAFGVGARVCPGKLFAEMEILFCIARILREFEISLEEGHPPMKLVTKFTESPNIPVRLALKVRQ